MDHVRGGYVLVIDDEPSVRNLLCRALPLEGFRVAAAGSGEEAVGLALREEFDAAICDIGLPGMDGVEVLKALKDLRPKLEVIMVTGNATVETAIAALKAGAYDYVAKPYSLDHLADLAARAVERKRLRAKVNELEEADRVKSEFLANMSHELRTPMNALMGYTSLLLDGTYGAVTEVQREPLERVLVNSKNLLALINNVLDYSKLNAGMMQVFLEDFDVADLLRETVDTMQSLAKAKGLAMAWEAGAGIPLRSDRTKVKQILVNLAGNAIKFTDRGTVTLGARAGSEGRIEFWVQDTGCGIAAEHLDFVFEQFTQVDGSSVRKQGGTGLGLSITKKLSELLQGSISVESRVGGGSVFKVLLPGASRPLADVPAIAGGGTEEVRPGRKVILSIDDDPEVLRLLRDSLSATEFEFRGALCADEGLALARRLMPEIITLDILMPRRDGWSVLRELKADPVLRPIPVFILSIIENQALGFSLGVSDYLVKPFDRAGLLAKLRAQSRLLGRKVLVVDDDPDIVSLMTFGLTSEGFSVVSAGTGAEALACWRQEKPDAMFLDMGLPDMSGLAVAEEMGREPGSRKVPVVILTGREVSPEEAVRLQTNDAAVVRKGALSVAEILAGLKRKLTALAEVRR
ncbi:MAG: response regulator [Elusimicrobia bacterium]|nr:response regulator [Elusimicrobiota bacterium]